jgi:ABC-type cobalamin/Fe3+-siderophores transport system ATPase subunit
MSEAPLRADALSVGYDGADILERLDLEIPNERITALVGANGSDKSTLLRALARLIAPLAGTVLLDGRAIGELPSREVARRLGLLPQSPAAPDLLTVEDLVARGRYPHQGLFRQWSEHGRRRRLPRRLRVAGAALGAAGARRREARRRQRPGDQLRGRRRTAARPHHRDQRRAQEERLRPALADRADRRAIG